MIYEIINPSDACCLSADDERVAITAAILLGGGAYDLRRPDQSTVGCLSLFRNEDQTDAYLTETFGTSDLGAFMDEHADAVACCLESILYTDGATYASMLKAFEGLEDRDERISKFCDEQRSSLNDIAERGREFSKLIRDKQEAA